MFLCNLDKEARKREIDHAGERGKNGWINVCVSEREWGPVHKRRVWF